MSAAPSLVQAAKRELPRRPLFVPLDLIVLRSGIPENLPGRCTDLSESGVGAVVAGELIPGQQAVAELRLPNMGVPVKARVIVRYQQRLHCGLQFIGLTLEQRTMIRYWASRTPDKPAAANQESAVAETVAPEPKPRTVRFSLRRLSLLVALSLAVGVLTWWQWERAWRELEGISISRPPSGALRVSPEIMERRIVSKAEPIYPETARQTGMQGIVVLDAVIGTDGTVKRLLPMRGPDLLVQAATASVQSWKFEPYLFDGKPREVATTITVEFRLR